MSDLETDPRQAAALMERVSDAIRHELDEYTHVSSESVYKGVSRSLTLGLRNLIESRMPDEVELYEISAVAAQRAKQGVG